MLLDLLGPKGTVVRLAPKDLWVSPAVKVTEALSGAVDLLERRVHLVLMEHLVNQALVAIKDQ